MIERLSGSLVSLLLVGSAAAAVMSMGFLVIGSRDAGALTAAEVNARLGAGISPVGLDADCHTNMRLNRALGQTPRNAINNNGAYQNREWISPAGNPGGQTIDVNYGTTSIGLQLNKLMFLCSSVVWQDNKGADYPYDAHYGLVTNATYPNDRTPNPVGSPVNGPAQTEARTYIVGLSSTAGNISSLSSQHIYTARQNNTRYWFSPPATFQLTSGDPAGFRADTTITVRATVRAASRYRYEAVFECEGLSVPQGRMQGNIANCNNDKVVNFPIRLRIINQPFNIVPSVASSNDIAYPGSNAVFTHTTQTTGVVDHAIQMSTYDVVLPPGSTKHQLGAQDNISNVCAAFAEPGATCVARDAGGVPVGSLGSGTRSDWFAGAGQNTMMVPAGAAVGSKVCRVFAINPAQRVGGMPGGIVVNTRVSAPRCVTVGKRPFVQVHGGGLSVGRAFRGGGGFNGGAIVAGSINTLVAGSPVGTYGSWGEYGIFAPGAITNMASGSGINGGNMSPMQDSWSHLTFTNNTGILDTTHPCVSLRYGCYVVGSASLPDVATAFPVSSAVNIDAEAGSISPEGLAGGIGAGRVVTAGQNVTVTGGNLGAGRWAVLHVPNHDVTITGNLTYDSAPYAQLGDIPQLVIIARNITINHDVERVDAWLIANNALATCEQQGTAGWLSANYTSNEARMTMDHCNRPLQVNGPVMANKLYMRRTASANPTDPGAPAEIFNLRPDAYLWLRERINQQGHYQTTGLREAPPRY